MKKSTTSKILNALAFAALAAAFALALELPSAIHARHCDGCAWFWCESYNGGEVR